MCLAFMASVGGVSGQRIDPSVRDVASFDWQNGTVSTTFAIGEIAIRTIAGANSTITQGFLQPETQVPCSEFELSYFPNPVRTVITIRDDACGKPIRSIEVYDTFGRWVDTVELDNRQADLELLTPGVYLVRAYGFSKVFLGAFKLIKTGGDEG